VSIERKDMYIPVKRGKPGNVPSSSNSYYADRIPDENWERTTVCADIKARRINREQN